MTKVKGSAGDDLIRSGWVLCFLLVFRVADGQEEKLVSASTSPGVGRQTVPAATAEALIALGARSAVIFAGQVLEVAHKDDAGYVDVVFRVETAVRGCAWERKYVLREWAGLWIGQPPRYVVGQRLLMLLAGRGPSGMSAPVGGMAGMIPLMAARQPPLVRGSGTAPEDTALENGREEAVDLRWVEALAPRQVAAEAEERPEAVRLRPGGWRGPIGMLPPHRLELSAEPSLSAVLALLGFRHDR